MGFKSFIKEKKSEFLQSQAASKQIRAKARAASFKAREENEIRLAREKERIRANRKIEAARNPPTFGSFLNTIAPKEQGVVTIKRKKGKKKKKGRRKQQRVVKPQKMDIFGKRGDLF